jgi:hypothetical protein
VDIDGNKSLEINVMAGTISTFETLPDYLSKVAAKVG